MNYKIELTREELTTILQVATGNVKDFVMDNDKFINKHLAAINYTHSCTELKEKKAIPFDDWTRVKGMKLLIDSNYRWDKTHVYKEVVHKMYEVYLINL